MLSRLSPRARRPSARRAAHRELSAIESRPEDPVGDRDAADGPATSFKRHELKFVLTPEEALTVRAAADAAFAPDPYAAGAATYRVHSLYLDTPAFDVYHRTEATKGVKYRLRRYGEDDTVWLERKRRRGDLVTKRRGAWPADRLAEILQGSRALFGWAAEFRDAMERLKLAPTLLVSYPRSAWVAGPGARVTIDWGVEARRVDRAAPFSVAEPSVEAGREAVLELKYDGDVRPASFERILRAVGREPGSYSKYGHGVEALGLVVARRRPPDGEPRGAGPAGDAQAAAG